MNYNDEYYDGEETPQYTREDFANVIERYLYSKTLTENDKYILGNLPFCTCTAFEGNEQLKERYNNQLKKLFEINTINLDDNLPDFVVFDESSKKEWYHPEFGGLLPPLEDVVYTTIYDLNGEERIVADSAYNVERTLIKKGYRFIRTSDYNERVIYFKG